MLQNHNTHPHKVVEKTNEVLALSFYMHTPNKQFFLHIFYNRTFPKIYSTAFFIYVLQNLLSYKKLINKSKINRQKKSKVKNTREVRATHVHMSFHCRFLCAKRVSVSTYHIRKMNAHEKNLKYIEKKYLCTKKK